MPADNKFFPWPSHYGHFNFFERRMSVHSRVRECHERGGGIYEVICESGAIISVFVCECYSFGVAEYMEVVKNFENIGAVIINSNCCGYTEDVKLHCRDERVGVFTIGDFMAALNRPDFWLYLNGNEEKRLRERGLI